MKHLLTLTTLLCLFCLPVAVYAGPSQEQLERIAVLVEEGSHVEALGQVRAFRSIWPENSDLRALERMLVEAVEAPRPAPAPAPRPAPQPSLSTSDRLEIQTAVTGVRNALNVREQEARERALREVLKRSIPSNASTSPWLPYWQARAIASLQLGDYREGWRAGKELVELGALESSDRALNEVVVELNTRGWLLDSPQAIRRAAEERYRPWLGRWQWMDSGSWNYGSIPMNYNRGVRITNHLNSKLELEVQFSYFLAQRSREERNSTREYRVEIPGNYDWRTNSDYYQSGWMVDTRNTISNIRIHDRPQRMDISVVQTVGSNRSENQIQLSLGGGNRMYIRIPSTLLGVYNVPPSIEAVRVQ